MAYIQALQLRSFRQFEEVSISPHPRLNVIIGNNGEGKSNLLESLEQLFSSNTADERVSFIKTGEKSALISAEFPEFSIQKQLTQRFEEFKLDERVVPFKQLRSRVEAVGISKFCYLRQNQEDLQNPMQDLYDVHDFDERQKQNRQSLKNAEKLYKEANELLEGLETQAKSLEEERGELIEYQSIFEQKQAAERAIAQFDLLEVEEKIEQNEQLGAEVLNQTMEARRNEQENIAAERNAETTIAVAEQNVSTASAQLRVTKQEKLELDELIAAAPEFYVSVQSESQNVESVADELEAIAQQRQQLTEEQEKCNSQLLLSEGMQQSAEQLKADLDATRQLREELIDEVERYEGEIEALQRPAPLNHSTARQEYDETLEKEHKAQAVHAKYAKQLQMNEYDLQKAEAELSRALPPSVSYPLTYIATLVSQRADEYRGHYFGPLYENICFDEGLSSLMDSAAGMHLFSLVVDTEATAMRLIEALNAESQVDSQLRGTRVQFLPLENYTESGIPEIELPSGAMELSQLVQTDDQFQSLINGIFGRLIVCQSMALANELSSERRLECYSLDGDCASGGLLTGGYRNPVRVRCCLEVRSLLLKDRELHGHLQQSQKELSVISGNLQELQASLIAEEREERILADKVTAFRMQQLRLEEALRASQQRLEDTDGQIELISERLAMRSRPSSGIVSSSADLREQLGAIELELFKLAERREFLSEKLNADQERRATLQAALDVHLARLRRALNGIQLPESLALSEALETAQRINNELEEEIAQAAVSQRNAQSELESSHTTLAKLQEEAVNAETLLADLEFRAAELRQEVQELQRTREALNIRILSAGAAVSGIEDQEAHHEVHFGNRVEAVKVAGACSLQLEKFEGLNQLAVEQYQLLREKLEVSNQRLSRLHSEQLELEVEVADCDKRFNRRFEETFERVQEKYCTFLYYLLHIKGSIELLPDDQASDSTRRLELKVETDGVPSTGQKAAARIAYALALQAEHPIILLDECDAALDETARQRFCQLIKELSREKQVICVTFSRAAVDAADAIFHVTNGRVIDAPPVGPDDLPFLQ